MMELKKIKKEEILKNKVLLLKVMQIEEILKLLKVSRQAFIFKKFEKV